jgi:dipeptidyl aminopeptidase/acylaminoacyl peptidase
MSRPTRSDRTGRRDSRVTRAAPYGSWQSPITAALLAEGAVGLADPEPTAEGVYWIEQRPAEGGRYVVVRRTPEGETSDVTPPGFSARTRVHEYGGGARFLHGETVFFANFDDQRLYRQDAGSAPRPITPEPQTPAALRYADGRLTPDGRLIICVRESHRDEVVVNELVALPPDGSTEPRVLASGSDFYSFPRVSPDGRTLAWTCWDHPRMPWDGTELWVAELSAEGALGEPLLVAGGPLESVFQPAWSPDGVLHFVSDRSGWWNLYRRGGTADEALAPMEAEFAVPQWIFGLSTYAFLPDGAIGCAYGSEGMGRLGLLRPGQGRVEDLETSHVPAGLPTLRSHGSQLTFVGASATEARAVVSLDVESGALEVLARSLEQPIDPAYISIPRSLEFPTDGGLSAHALFYSPRNDDVEPPPGERPPLLVVSHGGPTAQAESALDPEIQFWTSRGFAVVDVNYGGSTGYGREYRERLRGRWGEVDTADCLNAARHLAEAGEVDGQRLAIRGGSAGGYTTLCALAFHDLFDAGASYYGVADAELLAKDTHKFESRYLDGLIGPYPQAAAVYRERSPIHAADRISCPVILFQGLEDEIVPPSQAEKMITALERNGIPYAYLAFEGEQHGFRRAETIQRTLESELYFYSRILGFEAADPVEAVAIHNLS